MRKIGEKFIYLGVTLITKESGECVGCYFHRLPHGCGRPSYEDLPCTSPHRSDHTNVIYPKYIKFSYGK